MPKAASAKDVIEFALKFKGYNESPPGSNRTKFGEYYGMNGVPWCAEFTYYCLNKNHVPIIKSAYTPTVAQWFKDQKRGFTDDSKIKLGDVVLFDFLPRERIQHIGFAIAIIRPGIVKTVEGNTSSGVAGSQDDGGTVAVRERSMSDIVYIGRPQYGDDKPDLPRFDLPKSRTWMRLGDKGADVKTLQRDLNAWMRFRREHNGKLEFDFGRIEVSGLYSQETKKAVQTFQMQHDRLEPDGIFGRETERRLEAVRKWQEAV